jgi:hypothetical protein
VNERFLRQAPLVASVLTGLLSVVLGVLYFRTDTNPKSPISGGKFYADLAAADWSLGASELAAALASGRMEGLQQMMIRSALVRWRLRGESPLPFDRIMESYSRGLAGAPSQREWEAAFEAHDRRWIDARRRVIATGKPQTRVGFSSGAGFVTLSLADTPTVMLGSLLVVTFDAPEPTAPRNGESLRVLWSTADRKEFDGTRRKLGVVQRRKGAADGIVRFNVALDMSAEPEWTRPEAVADQIFIAHEGAGNWKPVGLIPSDSYLLDPGMK